MFLDINDIADGSLTFSRTLELNEVREGNADLVEAPEVRLEATVEAGPSASDPAEGAVITGRLSGALKLRCCRCLDDFAQPCESDFALTLRSEIPAVDDPDHQIEPEDTCFFEIEAGRLDLGALASEQIYLNLPLKPLCRPDCAGLCPTCGINRNRLECDCPEESVDPRLQGLQQIRDKMGPPRG